MPTRQRWLFEAPPANETADAFATRVLPGLNEGHEIITRHAAGGLTLSDDEFSALLLGVIRPDRGGASYWSFPRAALGALRPDAQRAHALRRARDTTLRDAVQELRDHFRHLYRRAMGASSRTKAFEWIGEALHLLQDSYSEAHTKRGPATGPTGYRPIWRVRFYGRPPYWPLRRKQSGEEHNFPWDDRDQVGRGGLTPAARLARDASREFVVLMLRHLRQPHAPANMAEVQAFVNRHLNT